MLRYTLTATFFIFSSTGIAQEPIGVLPVGPDGKTLNLDFETGTLKDWTAEGDAFKGQPIKGDTVYPRRKDNKSEHQGQYWIGGFEKLGDKPQGTLTSVPFKITHPWGSFLVAGGPWMETCVELVLKEKNQVFFRASGLEEENLRRVAVDLQPYKGKEMFIRIVDKHSGHWGHINFDDFRFHDTKPIFPARPKAIGPDILRYAGLPPEKSAQVMTLPEGFDVTLFAGEPDVMQPIALALDDRGRVWVAEAYSYPVRRKDPKEFKDRILIFEDTKGTGKFDKRTVFMEGLNLVSGLEVGFGGVWIGAAPYLMYVPMKEVPIDEKAQLQGLLPLPLYSGGEGWGEGVSGPRIGDTFLHGTLNPLTPGPSPPEYRGRGELTVRADAKKLLTKTVPAGEPQILLDGWGYQDTHETLNAFIWGPDGWLYGCHGVLTHSNVGKPGTPDKDRVPLNAGVWRYHPTRHKFEVFAHGTSNPWGLDFNDYGQAFVSACVIPHAFHMIQGGRYHRQGGAHFNPHTYADIKTIADHLHWQGANPWAGNEKSDSTGGGHAHCGLMCYLGGTWPAEYRGQLFMGNIHGRRINMDILKPKGSGYIASHGKDLLHANDAWARFINMRYGPDGNVYVIDWYDKQACHTGNVQVWDRSNGRIYKISHRNKGEPSPVRGRLNLQELSDMELVKLQLHDNDWYVRHARRILQERKPSHEIEGALSKILRENPDEKKRLRALWALHGFYDKIPYLSTAQNAWKRDLEFALGDKSPIMNAWAIRLASESFLYRSAWIDWVKERSANGSSPDLRLAMASALQGVDIKKRWEIAEKLLTHSEDADDHNLPLMYWYAIEPLADVDPARALALALNGKIPQLHGFMIRRIGAKADATGLLIEALAKASDTDKQLTFLTAIREAFKGRRQVPMPAAWPGLFEKLAESDKRVVRVQAVCLAVTFGNPKPAVEMMRDRSSTFARAAAVTALADAGYPNLAPELHKFLHSEGPPEVAIRALAAYEDPATPGVLIAMYREFTAEQKRDALNTLAARPSFAKALLDAIGAKKIEAKEVSADIVRQLRNLKDPEVSKRINDVWGVLRDSPAERVKAIADYKKMLLNPPANPADLAVGRAIFNKSCAQCHTLFGVGGKVGPDITGSNRANLDYLLENIIDPSAVIPKEYAATVIEMKNGRVLTGIIRADSAIALTVVTVNETLTVPRKEIETLTTSKISMMPDDLLKQLKDDEVRALIAYLQSPQQVGLKASN